jgi:hypothetical protein
MNRANITNAASEVCEALFRRMSQLQAGLDRSLPRELSGVIA